MLQARPDGKIPEEGETGFMTETEALSWISKLFEEQSLSADARREDVEAWDSLGVLTLMAGLDAEFGINLPDDEFERIRTVHDILDVMRRNGAVS